MFFVNTWIIISILSNIRNIILFEDIIEFIFLDGWWWYKCPSSYSFWYTFVEKYGYLFVSVGSFNGHIEVYFAATALMLLMTVSMMTLRETKYYVTCAIKRFLFLSGTTLKLVTGDIVRYEVKTIEVGNKIWNTGLVKAKLIFRTNSHRIASTVY